MPLPFLPSEKRICDRHHHDMATAILTLADSLDAHIPGSRKRIADLEAILWTPVTGLLPLFAVVGQPEDQEHEESSFLPHAPLCAALQEFSISVAYGDTREEDAGCC